MKYITIPAAALGALVGLAWLPASVIAVLVGIWTEDQRWVQSGMFLLALYGAGLLLLWQHIERRRTRKARQGRTVLRDRDRP